MNTILFVIALIASPLIAFGFVWVLTDLGVHPRRMRWWTR